MKTIKINNTNLAPKLEEIQKQGTDQANKIIKDFGKLWLSRQLKISYPTLYKRLKDNNWKPSQLQRIYEIHDFLF